MPAVRRTVALTLAVILLLSPAVFAHKAKSNAKVYIGNLSDGDVVTNPVRIDFGARDIEIAPVGVNIHRAGHHLLLVNVDQPESMDDVIPFDDRHLHFMHGETGAVLELPPGTHTLQLVLCDEEHTPWGEHLISDPISIHVLGEVVGARD